jgi:nitroimidazol reductase NimA-like FMN-containing flavoprotein (pyridoxamine 5'-phosphate oxidase superfamily)
MGVIRDLPTEEIETLLHDAIVYRIACAHPDRDRPYLVPIALAYDGTSLVGHTGPGTKLRAMRANPYVAIEVDHASCSDTWESVVADGTYVELNGQDAQSALRLMYPEPASAPELGVNTVVFRIDLSNKTGRFERPT